MRTIYLTDHTIEPSNAEVATWGNEVTVRFTQKESGFVIRFKTPQRFDGNTLRINYTHDNTVPVRLNVKFFGTKNTYQAWYVLAPSSEYGDCLTINLKGVKDSLIDTKTPANTGTILLMKIYCDDILPYPIAFQTFDVLDHPLLSRSRPLPVGLFPNGDFRFGMMGWEFWASNGFFRQNSIGGYQPWGSIEFLDYDPSTPKTEAFLASDYRTLQPGTYSLYFDVKVDKPTKFAWKFAWDDSSGASKISGKFYQDTTDLLGQTAVNAVFTIKEPLKVRLYLMTYSPTTISFTNIRVWPTTSNHLIVQGDKLFMNGRQEFLIGCYDKPGNPIPPKCYRHVQPDGIPTPEILEHYAAQGHLVWPELSGAVRAQAFKSQDLAQAVKEFQWDHPAVVGLYSCDEPDHLQTGVPPVEMLRVHQQLSQYVTWATVMSWNESIPYQYSESADILGVELYPVINRKSLTWCEQALIRGILAADGRPVVGVVETSPELTPQEQRDLLFLPYRLGAAGVWVWNEGIQRDPARLQALIEALQDLIKLTSV